MWNKYWWMRGSFPVLSDCELLLKDVLVARGHTETSARGTVLSLRSRQQSPTPATRGIGPEYIAELESALSDPVLGTVLRSSPEAFAAWVLERPEHDPIRRDYSRRYLAVPLENP